jgi:hypothetical protein
MSRKKSAIPLKQTNLFDPPARRPEWEQLPPEIQARAIVLLTELLLSPAAQRLLTQGGANE